MNRRRYLRAVSTTTLGLALAGCNADAGDADDGSDENGADSTATTADGSRQVDAAIAAAIGELNTGAAELAAAQDRFAEDRSFEFGGVADRVDAARSELDGTGSDASDQQATVIAEVRKFADVVAAMNDAFLTLIDVEDSVGELRDAVDAEAYDRAATVAADIESETGNAGDRLAEVNDAAASMDAETLESRDSIEVARLRDAHAQLVALAGGFNSLASAYGDLIAGREAIVTGRERIDAEEYEAAADAFGRAFDRFAAANETATNGVDADPPVRVADELRAVACQSDHLKTAADHFEASADAAADGDRRTAEEEQAAAEDALDAVDDC